MLRLDDVAFLACFNDGMGAELFLKQKLKGVTGPVSDVQLRELTADLAYLNVHLKNHNVLKSHFDLAQETHVIAGTPIMPELHELNREVRGQFMQYLFRDRLPSLKSYRYKPEEIEKLMSSGHLTFLFDENGAFFETSEARPPPESSG